RGRIIEFVIAIALLSIGLALFIPVLTNYLISIGYKEFLWIFGFILIIIGAIILAIIRKERSVV
ncbi:MAG: hypothetical protein AB1485_07825, partial [Candidatus Thermoplasmatota archaeon]